MAKKQTTPPKQQCQVCCVKEEEEEGKRTHTQKLGELNLYFRVYLVFY